jgi:hypothetical protein
VSGLKRIADANKAIESLRRSLKRAGIAETNVKATWDHADRWARIRIKATDGALICDHRETVDGDRTGVDALAAVARWFDKRTKLIANGTPAADAFREVTS